MITIITIATITTIIIIVVATIIIAVAIIIANYRIINSRVYEDAHLICRSINVWVEALLHS